MTDQIETLLSEKRRFPTTAEFAARAASTAALYTAGHDWQRFWEEQARALDWMSLVDPGARLEAAARQVVRGRQAQRCPPTASTATCAAPGATRPPSSGRASPATAGCSPTGSSPARSGRCANALKRLGVKAGDRVAIYMPMVPEAAIAMLACARIGAVHSVVFGGFSAEALRDRINDAGAVVLITADGGYRRGQVLPLKRMADAAMAETPSIRHCVVVRRQPAAKATNRRRDDGGP